MAAGRAGIRTIVAVIHGRQTQVRAEYNPSDVRKKEKVRISPDLSVSHCRLELQTAALKGRCSTT